MMENTMKNNESIFWLPNFSGDVRNYVQMAGGVLGAMRANKNNPMRLEQQFQPVVVSMPFAVGVMPKF